MKEIFGSLKQNKTISDWIFYEPLHWICEWGWSIDYGLQTE